MCRPQNSLPGAVVAPSQAGQQKPEISPSERTKNGGTFKYPEELHFRWTSFRGAGQRTQAPLPQKDKDWAQGLGFQIS
jgi:hypothetical protein